MTDLDAELSDLIEAIDRLRLAVQALVRVQVATYNKTLAGDASLTDETESGK